MAQYQGEEIAKSPRIQQLIDRLYQNPPEIEADRAVILTQSYRQTEELPIILRRARAFYAICEKLPVTIRPLELMVGSNSVAPRGCQVFPEYSFAWLEEELDTVATRSADPFAISEDTKQKLRECFPYWQGKTTSELATALMVPAARTAIDRNLFTPGNYYYNGIGHFTVKYDEVLALGFEGVRAKAESALASLRISDGDYAARSAFLQAAMLSCDAAMLFARRYAQEARRLAEREHDPARREELLQIAANCEWAPAKPARSFWEACQSFWFVQMLLQTESSGHSISPGRFDQYMFPYYQSDLAAGRVTREFAQELMDCVWVKLNDLNKVRDAGSAEGFAGYSLFQNLIAGGQNGDGQDVTNDLSYMCLEASLHVRLPAPSLSVRVWNGSPDSFLLKAGALVRTGIGLPAFYNDEAIIPALMSRGASLQDARRYAIIGCVEPQAPGKTDGWHDAAFFNMCRPLELTFTQGREEGAQVGAVTKPLADMQGFEDFWAAYQGQMDYAIQLLVNACNAIDTAHATRCPLPFQSMLIDDCIGRGKSIQEGGAIYNFTGPQGFGIANVADSLYAIQKLVFEEKRLSLAQYQKALAANFGAGSSLEALVSGIAKGMQAAGQRVGEAEVTLICNELCRQTSGGTGEDYAWLLEAIEALPKYGNDVPEVDTLAREVAYLYTRPLENYENPRGGCFQAGLYPVSANVPLGAQTGATPDGRLAGVAIADGVGPAQGRDTKGPTAACNSVAKLDHIIASNGTLFNQKFHPSALEGSQGLYKFIALIRGFFDQKGMHMQFNVVDRDTLLDAQRHPERYKSLVVRVAGYSALFTTLSRSLQDDIISRTTHGIS